MQQERLLVSRFWQLWKLRGVKEGKIGIVSVNAATTSTVDRDEGFRSAFEGTAFEILETQYADGDAAKSKRCSS